MLIPNAEFHIFRDARRRVPAADLIARLRSELRRLSQPAEHLITLLLLAGELESALHDAVGNVAQASRLTDVFAHVAVGGPRSSVDDRLSVTALQILDTVHHSGIVTVTAPEGFAHYALHPLDYADLVARLNLDVARAFVIGIRSIGTTLSAVVAAKLRELGIVAERTTVRPTGHPYDRRSDFDPAQRENIARTLPHHAAFLVCDEGPGRSGSSLLSVAEALEREGVPRDRIVILCAHQPDAHALCAPDAMRRWSRYRTAATGTTQRLPADAGEFIAGGEWRRKFIPAGEPWPGVWPQMERLKYLSRDRQTLLTFEGYGPYGAQVSARNRPLADAGFGACYLQHEAGFGRHTLSAGRAARRADLSSELLVRMAQYCAWRAREFAPADTDASDLEAMTTVNFQREFGFAPENLTLPPEHPAICDARMAPYEWRQTPDGRWLKLDAAVHGDDHFFPGPCDIAWDLAGIIVEWQLCAPAREFLLSEYRRVNGDDPDPRIEGYELAYATFRMAWSKMAAASVNEPEERERLLCDFFRYRQAAELAGRRQLAIAD